jgi:peptidoglycan/xylan/chitin deacetylase (PgdA/CDA1 family)
VIRNLFKTGYFVGASAIGAVRRNILRLVSERKAVVLNLHRVSPQHSPYWPPMKPAIFESLLRFLDENFEVRRLEDLSEPQGKRPIAVLSFDDGYYDFLEHALPMMRRYKMPSNMNVIPECAVTGRPIWNVRLYDFLASAPVSLINELDLPGFEMRLNDDLATSKVRFGMAISGHLKNRPKSEREELFQALDALMKRVEFPSTRVMTAKEIRSASNEVEIGAHSYSHESMGHETDEFFDADLSACERFFETELRQPLKIYAFPNGSYRGSQVELLRRKGVEKILLVDEKAAELDNDVVPRITMYGDTAAEVRLRSVGHMLDRKV